MLTKIKESIYDDDSNYIEAVCLSSDTKPTAGIANGSVLIEMDTKALYFFDKTNSTWREWS